MAINAFKVFRDALFFFRLRVCQFEYHCFVSLLVPKVGRRPWRCQFLRRLLLQCVAVEFACVPLFWDCQLLGEFGFLLFILWCCQNLSGVSTMEILGICIVVLMDLVEIVGGACGGAAVTSCNELCHPGLKNRGVVEVRFSGVWANIHCLPPNVRVRVVQK